MRECVVRFAGCRKIRRRSRSGCAVRQVPERWFSRSVCSAWYATTARSDTRIRRRNRKCGYRTDGGHHRRRVPSGILRPAGRSSRIPVCAGVRPAGPATGTSGPCSISRGTASTARSLSELGRATPLIRRAGSTGSSARCSRTPFRHHVRWSVGIRTARDTRVANRVSNRNRNVRG